MSGLVAALRRLCGIVGCCDDADAEERARRDERARRLARDRDDRDRRVAAVVRRIDEANARSMDVLAEVARELADLQAGRG